MRPYSLAELEDGWLGTGSVVPDPVRAMWFLGHLKVDGPKLIRQTIGKADDREADAAGLAVVLEDVARLFEGKAAVARSLLDDLTGTNEEL